MSNTMIKLLHDPGHGGTNKGCEHGGLIERKLVLEISRDLIVALGGFDVEQRLTRDRDATIDYDDRAEAGFDWGAQLVLCHHVNAMPEMDGKVDESIDGLVCFAIPTDNKALDVGDAIMRAAPHGLLRRKHRTIPATPYDWTKNTYNVMRPYVRRGLTCVLIEWGFATSPRDRAILQSPNSRPAMCAAAAAGVARAIELA